MKKLSALAMIVVGGLAPLSAESGNKVSSIVAATVEDTMSAQVIRMVVSPEIKKGDFDVVCGEGMIRVRLDGIANRGRKTEELNIPGQGPVRRARLIEKNPKNTVLQIIPRRKPLTTCERTSVATVGGEIIVSTARSDGEIERRKALQELGDAKLAAVVPRIRVDHEKAPAKAEAALEADAREGAAEESAPATQAESEKKLAFKGLQKDAPKSTVPSGEGVVAAPKVALGFGFAAVVAGLALYLKKKKKFAIDDLENIEILSTKRLGLKQQLMLVSVQGVKFLLAVGEKTVSALGTVPDSQNGPGVRALLGEESAPQRVAAKNNVSEVLEHLIGEASRHAALPVSDESRTEGHRFEDELSQALKSGLRRRAEKQPPLRNTGSQSAPGTRSAANTAASTNAAGLVALARMRANLKKNSGKSPVFEA